MNFFARQEALQRRTKTLVVLFLLALLSIIGAIVLAAAGIFSALAAYNGQPQPFTTYLTWNFCGPIALAVLGVLLLGTLYRSASLREGGAAVASLLRARKLSSSSPNPLERRLLNVVEEISIAAGVPVPEVYVLDKEDGINALAAGYQPSSAAIIVTRGALQQLTREELQGVIGHEFSHILNGDMRLNVRMIGLLGGILLLGILGQGLWRFSLYMRREKDQRVALGVAIFGIGVTIIGYVGLLWGRIIQSMLSRQREYLADAAAVQFTRNPAGLVGALKKIWESSEGGAVGKRGQGSWLQTLHGEAVSHMLFGEGKRGGIFGLFATHPPLLARIKALDELTAKELAMTSTSAKEAR